MRINILSYFEEAVEREPARIAIIDGNSKKSFSELSDDSKKLSLFLNTLCDNAIKEPIAVFMPKSYAAVVSDIAIIYSGNAYMNLDIKTPLTRVQAILERIKPKKIITTDRYAEKLSTIFETKDIINFDHCDFHNIQICETVIKQQLSKLIDTDQLCIINTSGSTGTPKGVVLNHRSFIDFIEWAMDTMPFKEHEVIASLSPIVFDIYSYELCLMMSKGATIVLVPDMYAAFPVKILQLMAEQHVTYIFWVPTIMVNIANLGLLDRIKLPDLHIVWFAGEVFPTKQFNVWRRALPDAMFVNMYGPIEITLDCTHYIVKRELQDNEPIPIGYAMRNTDILLLNEDNKLCAKGEEGELCVRGTSLAMGYYNNSEKTAVAFVQNPLNTSYPEIIYRTGDVAAINELGEIVFKGRRDTLVKHSGYRIELGEIEHVVVNTMGLFKNACVVYDHEKNEIVLFYEANIDADVADIKKKMSTALPRYMIPTIYTRVEEMPRNPNGKIDRLALKERLNDLY